MFLFMLGMLFCVGLAIVIIALIASPSFREGERFFTPEGEERVQNMRRRAAEDATRGREAVRSVVSRRRGRTTDEVEDEPTDVPAGPDYRVTDVDSFEDDVMAEDRSVRMAAPTEAGPRGRRPRPEPSRDEAGPGARERRRSVAGPSREDQGFERAASRRSAGEPASERSDRTVDLREDRVGVDRTVDLTQVEERRASSQQGRERGAGRSAGATAIGAVNRRTAESRAVEPRTAESRAVEPRTAESRTVEPRAGAERPRLRPATTAARIDLPAVSRHEEAYEQEEVHHDLVRPGRGGPRDRQEPGNRAAARWRSADRDEDATVEPAGTRDVAAASAAGEGGFMTRITGSLNRSGSDRTRTGPRHARG